MPGENEPGKIPIMILQGCNWLWRVLIAGVFLLAAWNKWQEGINFTPPWSIYDRLVAGSALRHGAIIGLEVLVGLWVLSSLRTRYAAAAAGLILSGFIVILYLELQSQSPSDCGCGITQVFPGGDPRVGLRAGIVRNAMLLLGCGWLMLMGDDQKPEAAGATASPESGAQPQSGSQEQEPSSSRRA